jgi:hypothetical protein
LEEKPILGFYMTSKEHIKRSGHQRSTFAEEIGGATVLLEAVVEAGVHVWRILLQLGEVVHLGLGAGSVVDGEQEHTCEGEEGKEEGRTGENYARVPLSRLSEPPSFSPSAPVPEQGWPAAAALFPVPPG